MKGNGTVEIEEVSFSLVCAAFLAFLLRKSLILEMKAELTLKEQLPNLI